jgi:hypothetical protein
MLQCTHTQDNNKNKNKDENNKILFPILIDMFWYIYCDPISSPPLWKMANLLIIPQMQTIPNALQKRKKEKKGI